MFSRHVIDDYRSIHDDSGVKPMSAERKVGYSALFTNLVRWHASTVGFSLSDVILAQLACPPE